MTNYTTTFTEKSRVQHQNKYDYSKLPKTFSYKDWVTIICPIHDEFKQKARTHVMGSGCQQCANVARQEMYRDKRHTLEDFIVKATRTHGDKYDYSQSVYAGQMHTIAIICPIHGEFNQIANNHVHGNGCSRCSDSKGERAIQSFLDGRNIEYETQKTFPDCKNYSRTKPNVLPFDIFIPSKNLLIEYDGKHHFEPVPFNGVSIEKAKLLHQRTIENDKVKNQYIGDSEYRLIRISYTENIHEILTTLL